MSGKVSVATKRYEDQRVAVVGMAVQYAGCPDKEAFWESLNKKEMNSSAISASRLGSEYREQHFAAERNKYSDTFCNERYGCISEDIQSEHDLLLKLAKSAIADMKTELKGGRCGIVSGCLSFPMDNLQGDMLNMYQCHLESRVEEKAIVDYKDWSSRGSSGSGDKRAYCDPATFVSQELALGPLHYSLDAACASALYVLRLAQDHLLSGSADTMLCGASCLPEPFFILSGFSTFHAMPLSGGVSTPLHSESQGLTPGEGGAIMVLKRLSDAIRDGDRIYGTLLGAEISNAGCGLPLSPHLPSEYDCMRNALERVHRSPADIQYVECHATGTPQGDRVEIEAMAKCFQGSLPIFGSTKGNFGHTLVAAGFAGMCKVLLAMQLNKIPPTPGLQDSSKVMHPNVVTEAVDWPKPRPGDLKRACLSAFGFGGTNAHAVFEEFQPRHLEDGRSKSALSNVNPLRDLKRNFKVAIVGMDATFGTLQGLDQFERAIYNGADAACDLPEKRWRFLGGDKGFLQACGVEGVPRGCYIKDVQVDFRRLRLPMIQEDILRPLQLLAVSTIDKALKASGMKPNSKVAVLVGLGTDLELYRHRARVALKERLHHAVKEDIPTLMRLMDYINDRGTSTSYTSYIGNLVATRVSSLWGFTGPSFTVTEGDNSVYRCLDLGRGFLANNEVDAVVIAGVDMCASAENLFVKSRRFSVSTQQSPKCSLESTSDGYFAGEGCGALVLKRLDDISPEETVYATIDSVVAGDHVHAAAVAAMRGAETGAEEIDLVEVSGKSSRHMRGQRPVQPGWSAECELNDLGKVFCGKGPDQQRTVALGSVKANIGEVGYASGAASLIKSALCIYNRYLPVLANWTGPSVELSESFYVCEHSRAWMKSAGDAPRRTLVSGLCDTGSCYATVLSEHRGSYEKNNRISLDPSEAKVLTVQGESPGEIVAQLEEYLREFCAQAGSAKDVEQHDDDASTALFDRLVKQTIRDEGKPKKKLLLALVTTQDKLHRELQLAARGIPRCVKAKRDWASPAGSFFTASPVASDKIAFMYGEGRSPYAGLGYDLHRIWPELHEIVNERTTKLWDHGDGWFLPRSCSAKESAQLFSDFERNQVEMFRLGVFASMCLTEVAKELLGLQPKAAFGLSLGEISMLFAFSRSNTKLSQEMTSRLRSSSVWTSDLAVDFNALRKAWRIPSGTPVEDFWQGYFVYASREAIEDAIGDNPFVRLLIVNDPQSSLIAGKPEECRKVLSKLDLKLPAVTVAQGMIGHCKEARPYRDQISHIHDMLEIPSVPGCKLFTTVGLRQLVPSSAHSQGAKLYSPTVGQLAAEVYQDVADFPSIVEKVHDVCGSDVFVEVGPNNLRSLAVKSTLGPNVKHVAVALDRRNESPWGQLMKTCAFLIAHQIPGVALEKLYHPSIVEAARAETPQKANKFLRRVEINGYFEAGNIEIPSKVLSCIPDLPKAHGERPRSVRPGGGGFVRVPSGCGHSLEEQLLDFGSPIVDSKGTHVVPPCTPATLGDESFLRTYNISMPLYTGAMAKGIASVELVIAAGKSGLLASFGAGGLPLETVAGAIDRIQEALPSGPYAVNLIHSPFDPNLEKGNVDLFLAKKVKVVEASAFMSLTEQIVRYRVGGLSKNGSTVSIGNRLIAKVSRTELAEMFIRPAPKKLLDRLLASGDITEEQAVLASNVPMADDITVEADSGGHTDNRPLHVLLPLIIRLRNRLHLEIGFPDHMKVRVGAAGGIGCPLAAFAAFEMGAAFVTTGTVNQLSREAGTCDYVRSILAGATYSDVTMAPAADMFDQGVKLQVLKKGTMFPARASKLFALFQQYDSLDDIPSAERSRLEKRVFKTSLDEVWHETKSFYKIRLGNEEKVLRAERDPKLKMSMCFRWYLSKSSRWANTGEAGRKQDYQIWCGPAIGAYNDFSKNSPVLDPSLLQKYPSVVQINKHIINGACYQRRLAQLRHGAPSKREQLEDLEYVATELL